MKTQQLLNYARDGWIAGEGQLAELPSAIDGSPVALTGSGGLDFGAMLSHARDVGGPALRKLTFHERARMLKALGDRQSTRLNSSHLVISYAVFCLQKKKLQTRTRRQG